MARIDSLAILNSTSGNDLLAESYGKVIDNVMKATISAKIKNDNLSGDPSTGTVEAKRFENTGSQNYGTARSGGGQKLTAKPVVIAINTDKELINEVEEKDIKLYGVDGLVARKSAMDGKSMERELEKAFFSEAKTAGTDCSTTLSTLSDINEKIEKMINIVETTSNDFVDGVPRDMINIVLSASVYSTFRNYLDNVVTSNIDTGVGEMGMYHGAKVYPSVYLPNGATAVAIVDGAIAQPVVTWLDEAGKFPASNAYHFGMFFSYGTKAVMDDLIQWANI